MGRNIQIEGNAFPARLRRMRQERRLTQADLAALARLTYRTVHDLEEGKRRRVQPKTLMLLAGALDVSYEYLLYGEDGPPRTSETPGPPPWWRRRRVAAIAAGVVLASVVAAFALTGNERTVCGFDGSMLTARDGLLKAPRWRRDEGAPILFCRPSPWTAEVMLVGLAADLSGGRLLAVSRRDGRTLWETTPDRAAAARAFGDSLVYEGGFHCRDFLVADLEGDGVPELVVRFQHSIWYPNLLCEVDAAGRRLAQYANMGSLYDMTAADIDGDGRDEVIAAGTNNARAYQGATVFVLDADHFGGAAVDRWAVPGSGVADSSRVRVVLPQFPAPYMKALGGLQRLSASRILTFRRGDGHAGLSVDVGGGGIGALIVQLDADLVPLGASPSDALRMTVERTLPDSLRVGTGLLDDAWRTRWLAGYYRFENGRRTHPAAPAP